MRRPDDPELRKRLDTLLGGSGPRTRVFLQGDGVDLAAGQPLPEALRDAADWQVCVGSWRRRHEHDPRDPFELATLAGWLDALLPSTGDSPELVSLGRGHER